MSEKGKSRKALREQKQEKQAKTVINWIFGVLILLAIIYMIWATVSLR